MHAQNNICALSVCATKMAWHTEKEVATYKLTVCMVTLQQPWTARMAVHSHVCTPIYVWVFPLSMIASSLHAHTLY